VRVLDPVLEDNGRPCNLSGATWHWLAYTGSMMESASSSNKGCA
jgi:hypothetical protein